MTFPNAETSDQGAIKNTDMLLRRVARKQIVPDANTGVLRVSSAAFKDDRLSVDSSDILGLLSLAKEHAVRNHPEHSLVEFVAIDARRRDLPVIYTPIAGNQAHCEVFGKKTRPAGRPLSNQLAELCSWVVRRV